MDKIALSKRLAGFSEVFKQETKFARDLKAMSMVIENLPEEKFAALMNSIEAAEDDKKAPEKEPEEDAEKEDSKEAAKKAPEKEEKAEDAESEMKPEEEKEEAEPEEKEEKEEQAKESSEAVGTFWSDEASRTVLSYLRKDVLGEAPESKKASETVPAAKLTPAQVPDGKGNKPASTLKPDQVPKQEQVLDSKMVEKSHGAVRKQASVEVKDSKSVVGGTVISSEGIELSPAMEEVTLTSEESAKLDMLFG